jgi:transcriptional regulator GlxA family with amidase domain
MKPPSSALNVAILIFDDVELLDFTGPFEVFSRARLEPGLDSRRSSEGAPFNVFTVSKNPGTVVAVGGLQTTPTYSIGDCPSIDLLVVPGGWGTRRLLTDTDLLSWINDVAASGARVSSVCTGSLLLAKAGLLRHKRATTHWGALDSLAAIDPTISVNRQDRFVDDGIVTSAGISAGIDMAFHLVEVLFGPAVARDTARYMDYRRP